MRLEFFYPLGFFPLGTPIVITYALYLFISIPNYLRGKLLSGGDPGDLYPVTRLMLPQLDRDRGSYGVKETMLAKLFVDMLKLGPNSADATRLKNYRAPTAGSHITSIF